MLLAEPSHACALCPRLAAFRAENRAAYPGWHNAPVASFGDVKAWLLIVGLAPGLRGANRTGRPFTGDYAGDLLYRTLGKYGLSTGSYGQSPEDGLCLHGVMITNAVRCVPPENKPTTAEIHQCRPFLKARIAALARLKAILALGTIAHQSVLRAMEEKPARHPFAHGAMHRLPSGLVLADSYHCSRYNTNTGRLTPAMFEAVFDALLA
ncbi:MAG: uracil-DNA glycosylase [Pseudomonadota bacterium]